MKNVSLRNIQDLVEIKGNLDNNDKVLIVVKKEFIENYPNFTKYNTYKLFDPLRIHEYLHNEEGPAVINFTQDNKSYWLNGQLLAPWTEEYKNIEAKGNKQ